MRRVMPLRKQSGVGVWISPLMHQEQVGAGGLGDVAAIVEHQRVAEALGLGGVLADRADHVEAGGLGVDRGGVGRRPVVERPGQAQVAVVGAPLPDRDRDVDPRLLRRDAHLLRAAPGDRADVAVLVAHLGDHGGLGGVELGRRVGHLEAEDPAAVDQALAVLGALEDPAVVAALALEHASCRSAAPWVSTCTFASRHATISPLSQMWPSRSSYGISCAMGNALRRDGRGGCRGGEELRSLSPALICVNQRQRGRARQDHELTQPLVLARGRARPRARAALLRRPPAARRTRRRCGPRARMDEIDHQALFLIERQPGRHAGRAVRGCSGVSKQTLSRHLQAAGRGRADRPASRRAATGASGRCG